MISITEEHFYNRIIYYKTEVDESTGEIIKRTRFDCRTFVFHDKDGKEVIFIGDRLQNIRYYPFIYVNDERRATGLGTKLQMATALQAYYTFCDIFNVNPEKMPITAYQKLKHFLKGIDIQSENGTNVTLRSVKTISQYLGMISKFLKHFGFECDGLNDTSLALRELNSGGFTHFLPVEKKYDSDLRSGRLDDLKAPSHFLPSQAKLIMEEITRQHDSALFIIFQLGFCYGLRIGEILGLTRNDIVRHENSVQGDSYEVIIRNRKTDRPDQYAKNLPHVNDNNYYRSLDYTHMQEKVAISERTYINLIKYYDNSWKIEESKLSELKEKRHADKCSKMEPDNFYVFTITRQTVSNHLKKYYETVGVTVRSPTHAMRHSFAMFCARYSAHPVSQEELRILLRHRSSQSSKAYYNLTIEDEVNLRNQFSNEIGDLIPIYKDQ